MDTKKEKGKNLLKTKYFDVIIAHAIFFHVMIFFTLLRISKGSTVIKSFCENCDSATTTPTGSASSQDICSICAHRLRVVFMAARCPPKKKKKLTVVYPKATFVPNTLNNSTHGFSFFIISVVN